MKRKSDMALAALDANLREQAQARLATCSETPFEASKSLAYAAFSSYARIAMAVGTDCSHLSLDSRSTDHVFTNKDHFVEYDTNVPMQHSFIYTVDGTPHKVEGTGFVHIRVKNGDSFFVVPLTAVHAPTFAATVVSTDCLVQREVGSALPRPHKVLN